MAGADSGRTLICGIVFLDIISYSKQPVSRQVLLKAAFNRDIADALRGVPSAERVILDTGDGASICFMGDPEIALTCAMVIRDAFLRDGAADLPELKVRIGIHLGPIKEVLDINGQRNILGDGINVAQRVMSFAEPGQILVSRAYFEAVGCMTPEYARLFHLVGTRADKHARDHVVYEVALNASRPPAFLPSSRLPAPATPTPHDARVDWADAIEPIRRELAEHVGPLAALLVTRALPLATDASHLRKLLSDQIDDPAARARFVGRVAAPAAGGAALAAEACVAAAELDVAQPVLHLAAIERALARVIGPLSALLVRRETPGARSDEALAAALARHIDQAEDRERFLAEVRSLG